mmetsp:Transcript_108540/g.188483  ORF Transcript_108540/g.188483 Transcript_108540/m.188483 type:complete len:430 (+) Transcript_108540:112-1401(+)
MLVFCLVAICFSHAFSFKHDLPAAAHAGGCNETNRDDYNSLLNLKTSIIHRTADVKTAGAVDESHYGNGGTKKAATGIHFLKMIKVGGELFGNMLAEYAWKKGWRVLQHKDCPEEKNPLGQATCDCEQHYIGPGELPPQPGPDTRYAALYTHMHYDPVVMTNYLVPGAVKLTILRHPLSVLRSAHAMAAEQAVKKPWIHDNFCQDLAHDGDAWRNKCEFVQTGQDSLLDYLDHNANEKLKLLLKEPREKVHSQAMAIIDNVTKQLETFTIGLQEDFDASMVLFQEAMGFSREDMLYTQHMKSSHEYHGAPFKAALESWGFGTPRGDAIVEKFRQGAYFYHELLYQRGVEIHKKQMRELLGSKAEVDAEVEKYRRQLKSFTKCVVKRVDENICTRVGLLQHVKARSHCARLAERHSSSSNSAAWPKQGKT